MRVRRRATARAAGWLSATVVAIMAAHADAKPPADAQDPTATCIDAHVEGQRLQRAGSIREARDALVRCARPECPALLVEECVEMLASVERAIPTVVFELADERGADVADARVLESGKVITERLDGKAIELDPGEHTFVFLRPGAEPLEVRVVIREGDRGRRIRATVPSSSDADGSGAKSIPTATWVFGGIGVVGLGMFTGFGVAGLAARGALDDLGCKPSCPSSDVDEARSFFLIADVSLAVGLAALATAGVFLVFDSTEARPVAQAGVGARVRGDRAELTLGAAW